MMTFQYKMESVVGPLYLVASEKALRGIFWKKQSAPMGQNEILKTTVRQLEEYFAGKRIRFDLPVESEGTPFQKKVWKTLTQIPYGETWSYRDLAKKVGNEKAVRAVGTANGRNPLSILVPCHRVISSDGSLGGYAGGLAIKEKLLKLERDQRAGL